jgi:glycosyltransferase involved in cell wall biosynthesis
MKLLFATNGRRIYTKHVLNALSSQNIDVTFASPFILKKSSILLSFKPFVNRKYYSKIESYSYQFPKNTRIIKYNLLYSLVKILKKLDFIGFYSYYSSQFEKTWINRLNSEIKNRWYDIVICDFFLNIDSEVSSKNKSLFKVLFWGGIATDFALGVINNEISNYSGLMQSNCSDRYRVWINKLSRDNGSILLNYDKCIFTSKISSDTFVHPRKYIVGFGCDKNLGIIRKKFNKNSFKCLFVGRVDCVKGVQYLLDTVSKIPYKLELSIVGEDFVDIKTHIQKYNLEQKISYLGVKESLELGRIYLDHDLFLFPSLFDGYGMVINEALSYGLPCIVSKSVGASNLIINFENGIVLDDLTVDCMVDAINWFNKRIDNFDHFIFNSLATAKLNSWELFGSTLINHLKTE